MFLFFLKKIEKKYVFFLTKNMFLKKRIFLKKIKKSINFILFLLTWNVYNNPISGPPHFIHYQPISEI
jgi:hypothetical protein